MARIVLMASVKKSIWLLHTLAETKAVRGLMIWTKRVALKLLKIYKLRMMETEDRDAEVN
jgi:hypothetical protein